ncbi:MAG: hypothetical protein J6X98_08690 [Bacteroidales bacterium]|nr:hypothetical protein [Bacteroidales bacterium]
MSVASYIYLESVKKKKHLEEVKERILNAENEKLPITIQDMEGVESITIDDLSFDTNAGGCYYMAYLHTTWEVYEQHGSSFFEYEKPRPFSNELVQKQIFVHVGITETGILMEWETDWKGAYREARNKRIQ